MTLYRDIRTGVLVKEVQTLTERTVVVETLRGRPRRYIAYKTELRAVTFYTRKNSTEQFFLTTPVFLCKLYIYIK